MSIIKASNGDWESIETEKPKLLITTKNKHDHPGDKLTIRYNPQLFFLCRMILKEKIFPEIKSISDCIRGVSYYGLQEIAKISELDRNEEAENILDIFDEVDEKLDDYRVEHYTKPIKEKI